MELNSEDLENLSPEEAAELQKKNCIFCQIAKGTVSAKKVYEDDKVIAILDINPANPGHTLILPKEHYMILPQVPEELVNYIFVIAKGISNALLKAVGATGTNIFVANGVGAGQRAPHFMVHVIPRIENDGIKCFELPQFRINAEELDKLSVIVSEIIKTEMEKKNKKDIKLIIKEEPEIIESKEKVKNIPKTEKSRKSNVRKGNETQLDYKKPTSEELDKIANLLLGKK
ncbi:MAG: HIT family protein [Candidatus Woesearchaeota archaeon]